MHRKVNYPLHKYSDCNDNDGYKITSFVIRTTDGKDEAWASKRAEATSNQMTEELICFSIVSYVREKDGKAEVVELKHPYSGFQEWSTKARNFVVAAWRRLATPNEEDLTNFFKDATEE